MKNRRAAGILAVAASLSLVLAGCASTTDSAEETTAETTAAEVVTEEVAEEVAEEEAAYFDRIRHGPNRFHVTVRCTGARHCAHCN